MTWSQTWSGNFLEKTPADMWKRNLDDERIIALDDMPGWDKYTAEVKTFRSTTTNKLTISLQGNNLNITIPQAGHTSIALFDMLGHKVASLAKGNLPAGTQQFNLDGIASGNYIVRAKNGTAGYAQRIRITSIEK
jgi:mannan endo-1,4-beta-mannosidase